MARPGPHLTVVPLTKAKANLFVEAIHRHHGAAPFGLIHFAIGVVNTEDHLLCGACIVGRPANRNSDDGQTAEVLRLATDGTPNACSALYGAAAAAARRMGFRRIITYTLESEPGHSLRALGWQLQETGIVSKWGRYERHEGSFGQVDIRDHWNVKKQRWGIDFREAVSYQSLGATDEATDEIATQLTMG